MQFLIIGLAVVAAVTLAAGLAALPARSTTRRRLARLADGSRVPIPQYSGEGLLAEDGRGWLFKLLKPITRSENKEKQETSSHSYNRQRLIEEISHTVASPDEVESELRHLFRLLARR